MLPIQGRGTPPHIRSLVWGLDRLGLGPLKSAPGPQIAAGLKILNFKLDRRGLQYMQRPWPEGMPKNESLGGRLRTAFR